MHNFESLRTLTFWSWFIVTVRGMIISQIGSHILCKLIPLLLILLLLEFDFYGLDPRQEYLKCNVVVESIKFLDNEVL
jgi:hypothetical protein